MARKSYYKKATYKGEKARGNSLHKGGMLSIDFNGFADYAEKIDLLGGDLESIFKQAMESVAETIQADTVKALEHGYLPAKGKYSTGDTLASVIDDVSAKVSGSIIEVPVGFDKTKPGAGGWLITGTPRMSPDTQLAAIYNSKSYVKFKQREIEQIFANEVKRLMK